MAKSYKWTCAECDAHGEAPLKRAALVELEAHFGAAHNQVPWMDDDE